LVGGPKRDGAKPSGLASLVEVGHNGGGRGEGRLLESLGDGEVVIEVKVRGSLPKVGDASEGRIVPEEVEETTTESHGMEAMEAGEAGEILPTDASGYPLALLKELTDGFSTDFDPGHRTRKVTIQKGVRVGWLVSRMSGTPDHAGVLSRLRTRFWFVSRTPAAPDPTGVALLSLAAQQPVSDIRGEAMM
jgi:hypothetical protein